MQNEYTYLTEEVGLETVEYERSKNASIEFLDQSRLTLVTRVQHTKYLHHISKACSGVTPLVVFFSRLFAMLLETSVSQ